MLFDDVVGTLVMITSICAGEGSRALPAEFQVIPLVLLLFTSSEVFQTREGFLESRGVCQRKLHRS